MLEQLFEVATEFRFDVGKALINTEALQQAVDGVSGASNNAMRSLNFLASGLVARLGFGSGGLLTVFSRAVALSESFDATSLNFSNVISANMSLLSGDIDTFNDRLETSKVILGDISKTAIKFALPTQDLARLTQLIATPLAQRGKLGKNFGNAIEMSKNLMLGAETVGLNPMAAGESLYRALTEHMPVRGELFARLVNTKPFKDAHVTTQMQLANIQSDKKIDLLGSSLKSLAMDSDALNFRLNSLHGQFTILQDMLSQLGSVLTPIGEAIKKPLIKVLKFISSYIETHGKMLGEQIGKLLGNIIEDPKGLMINLLQLKRFGADFKKALHLVELYGTFKFVRYILQELLGITFNGGMIRAFFASIFEGVTYLLALIPWSKLLTGVFTLLRMAVVEVLPLFLGFLFIFQIISRAMAIAKLNDIANWLTLTPRVAALLLKLKTAFENIMLPITMSINWWAELIAPLFETSTWVKYLLPPLEGLAWVLSEIGHGVVYALAGLSGLMQAIMGIGFDLASGGNPFKSFTQNFKEGFDDFLKQNQARLGDKEINATANAVYNIGSVNARFDMREQLEPDRIAFAVTEHLKDLASNPTQGRGQSLRGGVAGAQIANVK